MAIVVRMNLPNGDQDKVIQRAMQVAEELVRASDGTVPIEIKVKVDRQVVHRKGSL